jgi:hypothetical protein
MPASDWNSYRKCPVCGAPNGDTCRATSTAVSAGRPDGVAKALAIPHMTRALRKGRSPYKAAAS